MLEVRLTVRFDEVADESNNVRDAVVEPLIVSPPGEKFMLRLGLELEPTTT